ncbi:Serine/threonine-protein kinase wnk4 [Linnemannia gamsii]|uniref:Serine/threonine-protein kinase wnk4 n=1 Tax=Linnemannia gamsii TaxID=64522 RepID=A0ABQ7JNF0_9FUNG|nr:Serine/threonine-protein kinase wnk4 [Linnemannia gamsii]
MGSSTQSDSNDADGDAPVETDPSNRFQRLSDILGEGAYKHVYRAFDQEEGVEVAWNQLRIDHLTKKEAQKILSEIEILQSIRNDHIINFYASWSTKAPNGGERIVFVTELMSSGTLKQYLKKTLKGALKPKVLKSWCRQILQGLVYLHTHNPPIIHRDLKCDNIFINGNNGQLKIGDLGLAVVRHRTHVSSVLGTPEFMAPELYDEKYDEKVDIYAFGMCVLEMVTKEYPYSECTNQAQIYRKVTKGIKPQSLDHVKDPETWDFINRCLDHDDRTRPSAQELLDSDFLKPCANLPLIPTSAAGLYIHLGRSMSEGIVMTGSPMSASVGNSSNRSSFAEPYPQTHMSLATSPTSALQTPMPALLPRTLPSPIKVDTQPIAIPSASAAFTTTTTVDADNKTYHIRSNLLPQTPTSSEQSSTEPIQDQGADMQEATSNQSQNLQEDMGVEPPTLHSHANSKTCSIQVVQYGEAIGDQLNLKMICTCPVAGPRDVNLAAGTHEIKFPFDMSVDTVDDVVAEMIREQILSGDDREEATSKIQELIDDVVLSRRESTRHIKEKARSSKSPIPNKHGRGRGHGHGRSDAGHSRAASNNFKNGHNRQLNVPSVYDMDQYGTSPTESLYDDYPSVGSNGSGGWNDNDSRVESDQGYGTVPPKPSPYDKDQYGVSPTESLFDDYSSVGSNGSSGWNDNGSRVESDKGYGTVPPEPPQQPPVVTEATFPPLQHTQPPRSREQEDTQHKGEGVNKYQQATYSEAVQHPTVGQHPLSPPLLNRELSPAVSSRPQSVHSQDKLPVTQSALDLAALQVSDGSHRATLRDIETAAAASKKAGDGAEDVGYTSPYRHGVSSSSITYHRRSPSVDTSAMISSAASTSLSAPLHSSPSEPLMSSSSPVQAVGDQHRPSFSSTISAASSPEIRPISARSSIAATLNGTGVQSSTASRSVALVPTSSTPRPALAPLSIPGSVLSQEPIRLPHSNNEREYHSQQSHQHAFTSLLKPQQQQPLLESMLMSHTLKDADSVSGRISHPDRMNAAYTNGSNYSSCPEMSDDDEILDEDLKVLREQQRQELEVMRLQHVQQWEKMMKLKEQKGPQERTRRKSDVSITPRPPSSASTPVQ